jgi:hypothetical protein
MMKSILVIAIGTIGTLWSLGAVCAQEQSTKDSGGPHYLQLVNKLDRPNDGYCFDVQGVVGHFRADKPLVAHNCKQGAAPDGLLEYTNNRLFFPTFGACVTAMGTGTTVLPGASLMLKACKETGVFASLAMQKTFNFNKNQQLELSGTGQCVVVSSQSAHTLSSRDRWRTLYLNDCTDTSLKLSQWQLITP